MRKYFNNGTRTVSCFFGVFVFLGSWVFLGLLGETQAFVMSLFYGTLTAFAASILLPAFFALRDRRYKGIEQALPQPVLLKVNVSVRTEDPPRDGYLFFTAGAIYLYTRDRKPYIFRELTKEQIHNIRIEQDVFMTVLAGEGEQAPARYSFVCSRCKEAAEILRHNGWKVDWEP